MTWYRKKGFRKDPLHDEPWFKDPYFGNEALLDELYYRISAGAIICVEGNEGKTALLLQLIKHYKGKNRIAYVNCETVSEEPDVKKLLGNGKQSMRDKVAGLPKKMIIMLDNVSELSADNSEKIKYLFDEHEIHAVILATKDYSKLAIPESIKHRIGRRVYTLRDLTKDERVDIILERLRFPDFIQRKHVDKISQKSTSMKHLLEQMNSLFFLMENERSNEIDTTLVNRVLK